MIILSILFACGDKDNSQTQSIPAPTSEPMTAPEAPICIELTPLECSSFDSCAVISGLQMIFNEDNDCYDIDSMADVGCMESDRSCTAAETSAAPSAEGACHMFSNGCIPEGWVACGSEYQICNEPPTDSCDTLDIDQCDLREDCYTIQAWPLTVDTTIECYSRGDLIPVGCMPRDMDCGDLISYGASSDSNEECHMFMDTCLPEGWGDCEENMNSYTECD